MTKTTKWVIDPMHSEVQFKIKHLVISNGNGFFQKIPWNGDYSGRQRF